MGIASLGGILSGAGNVNAPDTSQVGNDFMGLVNSYLQAQGPVYQTEAALQPAYTALANRNLSMTRQSNVNDVAALSPEIMNTLRTYNRPQTGLLDRLTQQAQEQLKLNGALDPATQRNLEQSIRGSQAARGMGYGPGDAALEAFYQTQTAEQRRAANQDFASRVATQTANTYGDPFRILMGYSTPAMNEPSITNSGSLLNFMGIPYQGNLSAAEATARNTTGLYQSMDENSTKFMSGLMSTGGAMM